MNIIEIITNEHITIKYQPIMSTHNQDFLGVEALARGYNSSGTIPPNRLFAEAATKKCTLELDKLCIKKSLDGFKTFHQKNPNAILFLNIDATVIRYYIENNYILESTKKASINPKNIVLEINELHSDSLVDMKTFAEKYSALGYLIALDDVGAGSSNLDRIPLIMPNIMKIDRDLIHGLHKSYYKIQVVSMVIQLAVNIGSLIVVEGIEHIEELNKISDFGAHLVQGYYLGKPKDLDPNFSKETALRIKEIINELHTSSIEKSNNVMLMNQHMKTIASKFIHVLIEENEENYDHIITALVKNYNIIESIYIINDEGILVTDTIFSPYTNFNGNTILYIPCKIGDSVQLQSYYTNIVYGGYEFCISTEYISRATGNKCCTFSHRFKNNNGDEFILCIDFWKNSILKTNKYILQGEYL